MSSHEMFDRQDPPFILFQNPTSHCMRVTTNAIACQPNTTKCNAFTMKRRKKLTPSILVHELERRACRTKRLALCLL